VTEDRNIPGRLAWKLVVANAALFALCVCLCLVVLTVQSDQDRMPELKRRLQADARLLAAALETRWSSEPALSAARPGGDEVGFVVLTPDGEVRYARAPTLADPAHVLAPHEVAQVLLQDDATPLPDRRTSSGRNLLVAAARVGPPGQPLGVVCVVHAQPGRIDRWLAQAPALAGVGLVVLLGAAALGLLVLRLWSRPLREIVDAARTLGRGDLSASAAVAGSGELDLLGRSLNQMRDQMLRNYQTIDRQRRVLESLLTQLREGVIVADASGRIVLINPAAVRLLSLPPEPRIEAIIGMAVERCIPHHDVQQILCDRQGAGRPDALRAAPPEEPVGARAWEARMQVESESGVTHLLAHVSDILLTSPELPERAPSVGRLLVLTDITALTRTVQMKTDFVANASHELRTPLSAIRAAVETLERIDLAGDREAAEHFIRVIDRQRARLEALAGDLLELSRLEADAPRFQPVPIPLAELLEDVRAQFAQRISDKRLAWQVDLDGVDAGRFVTDPTLLRLVLDNLVDNAVKFSNLDGRVRIHCHAVDGAVSIAIADEGCGIAPEDRERVFERFFQVERARSGTEHGTGLGLSIVRHAAAAMQGEVTLDSELGAGTCVTVTLPQPDPGPWSA
jgi:two-component system phosphate regulon sensor histidine kinase PhoR